MAAPRDGVASLPVVDHVESVLEQAASLAGSKARVEQDLGRAPELLEGDPSGAPFLDRSLSRCSARNSRLSAESARWRIRPW